MPDDDVRDTVLLRPGVGVGGTEPGMPEVVSAEVVVVGLKKQVNRRFSRRLWERHLKSRLCWLNLFSE